MAYSYSTTEFSESKIAILDFLIADKNQLVM